MHRTTRHVLPLLLVVVAASVAAVAILSAGSPYRRRAGPLTTRTMQPTTAPPSTAVAHPPFTVGIVHLTVVDPSRPTPARGPTPAAPHRPLSLTVRYPIAGTPPADEIGDAPALRGRLPLVVFAHGFALSDGTYPRFLHDLAAQGFVVADPEFPLSSAALPGPAVSDPVSQAADVSFVISSLLDPSTRPAQLAPVDFTPRVGVVGHSDGGITAAGVAGSACCADPRVGAAVILAGALSRFTGPWFASASPPLLAVHGDADTVNPFSSSEAVYAAAQAPKMLVVVHGGAHIGAFEDDAHRPAVVRLVADFLRAYLVADADAAGRLESDAHADDVLDLVAAQR